jgi:hypothetical protein
MERLAKELYSDGYFGHVCIDSMLLEDADWIPIVEINARKSMSLMKNHLDKHLIKMDKKGNFNHYKVSYFGHTSFEKLLHEMNQAELLFVPGKQNGVIPLSANTLTIAQEPNRQNRGRLYFSLVYETEEERHHLNERFKTLITGKDFQILR